MMSHSSKRSSNFSTKEIKFLIKLVDSKKEIIESKKSNRATSEEKVKAWMEIEEEFNSVFEDYRSFKVLKTKYDNLKKNVRRKMSANLSNLNILKIMREADNEVINEPLSSFEEDISEGENTLCNSNASDLDMKPLPSLNEEELDAAAEDYVLQKLSFAETQTSPLAQQTNTSKPRQRQSGSMLESETANDVDVWEEVAHKKLKKLDLEIKVIEEEWILRKYKLELETEYSRIENRLKEEKLKLELELLKKKLQNNSSS